MIGKPKPDARERLDEYRARQETLKAMEIPTGRSVRARERANYMAVCEAAMLAISTAQAPWHVIPPTCKRMISRLLIDALDGLKIRYTVAGGFPTLCLSDGYLTKAR